MMPPARRTASARVEKTQNVADGKRPVVYLSSELSDREASRHVAPWMEMMEMELKSVFDPHPKIPKKESVTKKE